MPAASRSIGRRAFLAGLAATAAASGLASAQPANVARVGYVQALASPVAAGQREALVSGLRERGWIEGQNIVIETRSNDEDIAELVKNKVDVLVLPNPYRIELGLKLTRSIPIVTIDLESDPVAKGYVKSLARPGGNVTGIWTDIPEIAGKQVQLLKEAAPGLRRVTVVWDDRVAGAQLIAMEAAARAAGITVHRAPLRDVQDAEAVIKSAVAARSRAIITLTSPIVFRAEARLAQLAVTHRLPSMSGFTTFPTSGGLMAYGPNFLALWKQSASYVDRILRGASPAELPVERPAKFELRINARIAKAIGLTLPPAILVRADEVIE